MLRYIASILPNVQSFVHYYFERLEKREFYPSSFCVLKKKRLYLNLYLYRFNQVRSEREWKNDFTSVCLSVRKEEQEVEGRMVSLCHRNFRFPRERASFHGSNGSANRETGSSGITAVSKQNRPPPHLSPLLFSFPFRLAAIPPL